MICQGSFEGLVSLAQRRKDAKEVHFLIAYFSNIRPIPHFKIDRALGN